jgi:hypothetical protein
VVLGVDAEGGWRSFGVEKERIGQLSMGGNPQRDLEIISNGQDSSSEWLASPKHLLYKDAGPKGNHVRRYLYLLSHGAVSIAAYWSLYGEQALALRDMLVAVRGSAAREYVLDDEDAGMPQVPVHKSEADTDEHFG